VSTDSDVDDLTPDSGLVSTDDPDWVAFKNNDPAWFLKVASSAIRQYCGWDIFPNTVVTAPNLPIESQGMINLPSMYVTAVENVLLQDPAGQNNTVLDPAQYNWFQYGVIEPVNWQRWGGYTAGGYGPENWSFLPGYQTGLATVTFSSGYDEVPADVKAVAFELVTTTMEVSAGNVKEIQTPGYKLQLSQAYGATLNGDQKNRLSSYRLPTVK
jgi:hypothetical protein